MLYRRKTSNWKLMEKAAFLKTGRAPVSSRGNLSPARHYRSDPAAVEGPTPSESDLEEAATRDE